MKRAFIAGILVAIGTYSALAQDITEQAESRPVFAYQRAVIVGDGAAKIRGVIRELSTTRTFGGFDGEGYGQIGFEPMSSVHVVCAERSCYGEPGFETFLGETARKVMDIMDIAAIPTKASGSRVIRSLACIKEGFLALAEQHGQSARRVDVCVVHYDPSIAGAGGVLEP